MMTALSLHADAAHVIGNAISGTIFGSAVSRRLGPGGALLGILLAGTFGNAANAIYHMADGHRSIGASTAVFGALGILAAIQTALIISKRHEPRRRALGWTDILGPLVGGLALLGALGAGNDPKTDVSAHGFGFLAGLVIGGVAAVFAVRDNKPSPTVQVFMGIATVALLCGGWALALYT